MADTPTLGRLERVDLRTAWESEAQDFTPWLAQDENIAVLGETLDMELEVEAQEKDVGPFRADILCRDANSTNHDSLVLIENQLERTDHTHLGQLLTYAAGLHTVTIIWVARRFTEEHRAALDWLNEITDERIRFFGLEVELWKIGGSPAAPKFNIVSKPNEWSRVVGAAKSSTVGESERGNLYRRYWTEFSSRLAERNSPVKPRQPQPQIWMDFAIGRTDFWLAAMLRRRERRISVYLGLRNAEATAHLGLLEEDREGIEATLGDTLQWRELPKSCQVLLVNPREANPEDESQWAWQHKWLAETLENFDRVFRPRVADLDASDWVPDDTGDDE